MEKIKIYIIGNGGLEPDTAMSIAAPNGAIYLCCEY